MRRFIPSNALWWLIGALPVLLLLPTIRFQFVETGFRWLYVFLFSFSVSYTLTPFVRSIAIKRNVLDRPNERKIHLVPTPLLGGLAVYLGILGSIGANAIMSEGIVAILLAGTLIMVVGLIDDVKGLSAGVRLCAQLLAMAIVMLSGKVLTLFPAGWIGSSLNVVVTVVWIIGITNALNFFDGMDGLATGLTAIIAFFLGVVAFQTDQPLLGWFAVAIVGSCLGFLPYNFRPSQPATIFLGDTGSSFLGFILACLAVKGNWAEGNPIVSLSNPILIFGVL
ncbi:MAG: glycosyltransferase family 4 protein, partial [Nitrospiria bacterium]